MKKIAWLITAGIMLLGLSTCSKRRSTNPGGTLPTAYTTYSASVQPIWNLSWDLLRGEEMLYTLLGLVAGRLPNRVSNRRRPRSAKSPFLLLIKCAGKKNPLEKGKLSNICAPRNNCHLAVPFGNNLDLRAVSSRLNLVGANSLCINGKRRVVPDSVLQSYFIDKLETDSAVCGGRMTRSAPLLQATQVNVIKAWINAGAPNN